MITPASDISRPLGYGQWTLAVVVGTVLLFQQLFSGPVAAQEGPVVDWRADLVCPQEQQVYDGLLYCTTSYTDSLNGAHTFHVLVADLSTSDLRLEYIISKGWNADNTTETPQECRDPNRPDYGDRDAKGCAIRSGTRYPTVTLSQAVTLAREYATAGKIDAPGELAAVINADYSAPPEKEDHGPEGLMVIRGERLDGAAHCDDDLNAVARPWLAVGATTESSTALIPAAIGRLETDNSPLPIPVYTGIGGGPWLVEGGRINANANSCEVGTGLQLANTVDITNCLHKDKPTPPQAVEEYGNSCYQTAHTAAGLSANKQWLFLVVTSNDTTPEMLGDFMLNHLGATDALKFDGGGSTHLWYKGSSEVSVDPRGMNRALNNHLAIFATEGTGITSPLQATPKERILQTVLSEGEEVEFTLEMRNSGPLTWKPEDGIKLQQIPSLFDPVISKPSVVSLQLTQPVPPGNTVTWKWRPQSGGVKVYRFQMAQRETRFGTDFAVIVVTVPKALEDQKDEITAQINAMIEQWKQQGQQDLEELAQEIQHWMAEQGQNLLQQLLQNAGDALEQIAQQMCSTVGLSVVVPVGAVLWLRRRRLRA